MKFLKILHLFAVFLLVGLAGPAPDSALADGPKASVQQLLQSIPIFLGVLSIHS